MHFLWCDTSSLPLLGTCWSLRRQLLHHNTTADTCEDYFKQHLSLSPGTVIRFLTKNESSIIIFVLRCWRPHRLHRTDTTSAASRSDISLYLGWAKRAMATDIFNNPRGEEPLDGALFQGTYTRLLTIAYSYNNVISYVVCMGVSLVRKEFFLSGRSWECIHSGYWSHEF